MGLIFYSFPLDTAQTELSPLDFSCQLLFNSSDYSLGSVSVARRLSGWVGVRTVPISCWGWLGQHLPGQETAEQGLAAPRNKHWYLDAVKRDNHCFSCRGLVPSAVCWCLVEGRGLGKSWGCSPWRGGPQGCCSGVAGRLCFPAGLRLRRAGAAASPLPLVWPAAHPHLRPRWKTQRDFYTGE